MNKQKNYKQFDYQTVLVKKDKLDEVVANYESFAWRVLQTTPHYRYANILEVEFERNHFIDNKDDLQFLQVNMECEINKRGRLERFKHVKSTAFGSIVGVAFFASIICAVLSFINLNIVLGSVLSVVALTCALLESFVLKKIIKKENEIFETKANKINNQLNEYCKRAKALTGGQDE